jgi:hypothetical protein
MTERNPHLLSPAPVAAPSAAAPAPVARRLAEQRRRMRAIHQFLARLEARQPRPPG